MSDSYTDTLCCRLFCALLTPKTYRVFNKTVWSASVPVWQSLAKYREGKDHLLCRPYYKEFNALFKCLSVMK